MRKFDDFYYLAKKYYKENGNLLVPLDYKVGSYELGKWINKLRTFNYIYRLTDEEMELLSSIGMVWNMADYRWNEVYKVCLQYFFENHNMYIPTDFVYNDVKIGRWIHNQKLAYRNGKLSFDRIKKLEFISTPWDLHKAKRIEKLRDSITLPDEKLECFSDKYDVEIITGLLILMLDSSLTIEEIVVIRNSLKDVLNKNSYNIFILFSSGLSIDKIADIYSIDAKTVEKMRLTVYKILLDLLKEKKYIETKIFVKRVD